MYIRVILSVCVCVCVCVRTCVCVCVCIYICVTLCVHVCVHTWMCLYQDVCACVHVRALWTSTYRSLCDLSTARKKKISVSMMQGKTPTTWRWLWEYYCPSKILFLNWSVSLQWLHHTKTQKVHTLCVTQDHQRKSLNYIYWTECKQIRNYPSPATVDSSWQTGPTTTKQTKQKRRYFFHNFTVRAIF